MAEKTYGGTSAIGDLDTGAAAKGDTGLDSPLRVLVATRGGSAVADAHDELLVLAETSNVVGLAVRDLLATLVAEHSLTTLGLSRHHQNWS